MSSFRRALPRAPPWRQLDFFGMRFLILVDALFSKESLGPTGSCAGDVLAASRFWEWGSKLG